MAGPGTKRTDSPGALPQTPPNRARGGSSRRPVLGSSKRPRAAAGTCPDPSSAEISPSKALSQSRRVSPGASRSPPEQRPCRRPAHPGAHPRSPARPFLGVEGEKVPAIIRIANLETFGTSSAKPHYMPARIGRARLGASLSGGDPLNSATNQQPCPVIPSPPLPYSPASAAGV